MALVLAADAPDLSAPLGGTPQRRQESLLFLDTPDFRLWGAGYLLVQRPDGLHLVDHREPTRDVASHPWRRRAPRRLSSWPAGELRERLRTLAGGRALITVARADVLEERWGDGRRAPVVRRLADAPGTPPWAILAEAPSSPWIGWRIVEQEPLAARVASAAATAERPALRFQDPDEPAADALRRLLDEEYARAEEQVQGLVEDIDQEYLHLHRVSLRRVRSLLKSLDGVFSKPETDLLRARLGDQARASNRLRDLDVWLERGDEFRQRLPPALHPGLDLLLTGLQHQRREAHRQLVIHLRQQRRHGVPANLRETLRTLPADEDQGRQPIRSVVRQALWQSWSKTARRAAKVQDDTPAEDVHEVRIRGKRLRYLLDAGLDLTAGPGVKELVKQLRKTQDLLGRSNDASVQLQAVEEWLGAVTDQASAAALGGMAALLQHDLVTVRPELLAALSDVAAPAMRHRCDALFRGRSAVMRHG